MVHRRLALEELAGWLSGIYGTLGTHLQRIGVGVTGPPFVRYLERGASVEVEAGFPTAERITPKDEVSLSSLPGGTAATTWHPGAPDDLDGAFEAVDAWMQQTGVEPAGAPWGIHHIDPTVPPERESWMTEVVQLYRD